MSTVAWYEILISIIILIGSYSRYRHSFGKNLLS